MKIILLVLANNNLKLKMKIAAIIQMHKNTKLSAIAHKNN